MYFVINVLFQLQKKLLSEGRCILPNTNPIGQLLLSASVWVCSENTLTDDQLSPCHCLKHEIKYTTSDPYTECFNLKLQVLNGEGWFWVLGSEKKRGVWVYNHKNSVAGFTLIFSMRKIWPPYTAVSVLALVLKIHLLIPIAVSNWL